MRVKEAVEAQELKEIGRDINALHTTLQMEIDDNNHRGILDAEAQLNGLLSDLRTMLGGMV